MLLDAFHRIVVGQQVERVVARRQRLVLEAPTGSGKTVTMAAFLQQLIQDLPLRTELPERRFAFVWIAPNLLHQQSLQALRSYFEATRALQCRYFNELAGGELQEGDVLFLNWESIWSKKNTIVQESESARSLYEVVDAARLQGIEIVVVIDEAHVKLTGEKCQAVLVKLDAAMEIEVSATPEYKADFHVKIPTIDVIQAGMIKKSIVLNPRIGADDGDSLNELLIREALKKREQLERLYRKQGSVVRPLLLVQLPNDSTETESAIDRRIHETVVRSLEAKGITTGNGKLAIWLSGAANKVNNEDAILKPFDSTVDVLLFKQAIATGWDCPRAAVLLIFRELKESSFTVQTVGRILRMPEQRHYVDDTLNYGYVYTDLSREVLKIEEDARDYITFEKSERIDAYQELELEKHHLRTWGDRKVLGYRIRSALKEAARRDGWLDPSDDHGAVEKNLKHLFDKLVQVKPGEIVVKIPRDTHLGASLYMGGAVQIKDRTGVAKTSVELMQLFDKFCSERVRPYEVHRSTGKLKQAILELMEDWLLTPEPDTCKLVLCPDNEYYWNGLIDTAKAIYEHWVTEEESRRRVLEAVPWDVPTSRSFTTDRFQIQPSPHHAMQEFYESKSASSPEKAFVAFLEDHGRYIQWWYKNGDSGKEHFSVSYAVAGKLHLFYVDFLVLFVDGTLGFFDTKTRRSDADAHLKHNALRAWMREREARTGNAHVGGVVIHEEHAGVWKFSRHDITNTDDLTGWSVFLPSDYAGHA
ncbi:MAG: DEAD/DEAH box helicase family protein [Fibrobacteres bacterium]|nr:DEAD/DEAH box helicase family protein [Fibrobacterota bacterium]